jgi:phosphoglycolate phosphatase-like HAD superfamily hydrolase
MNKNEILALDFDGVICDSAGELVVSGWKGAGRLWPERFAGDPPDEIVRRFRRVRPVMKTGYESILLVRLLRYGFSVGKILQNGSALLSDIMRNESLEEEMLVRLFGQTRDIWIGSDLEGWIGLHEFYDGVVEAVNLSDLPVYIITTKEKRFAVALCRAAGLKIPEEHIFGLESGKKCDVLAALSIRHPTARLHFVEDRLPTLIGMIDGVDFDAQLYFADWGYITDTDREKAEKIPEIQILTLDQFPDLVTNPKTIRSV